MPTDPGSDKIECELAACRGPLHGTELPDTCGSDVHRAIVDIHRRGHCWQDGQERAEYPSRLRQVSCPAMIVGSIGCHKESQWTAGCLWTRDKLGSHSRQRWPVSIDVIGEPGHQSNLDDHSQTMHLAQACHHFPHTLCCVLGQ